MKTDDGDGAVRVSVTVEAPVERAFQIFTEQFDAWWPRSHRLGEAERVGIVFEPGVGGRWYEQTADGTECDWGRVLEWDPPAHMVLSWQIGIGFVPELDPERASRVDVSFEPSGADRTTVTVAHSDFERHGEGWEAMREGVAHEEGWPGVLGSFAELVARRA